jgi:soluble lytic murein transglycosylase-like protein
MFVAVWRYSSALALVAGALTQPALAHGRSHSDGVVRQHRHDAYMRAASGHRFARFRSGQRDFATMHAPGMQAWADQSAPFMAASYEYRVPVRRGRHRAVAEAWQTNWGSGPQDYWQNGWRGRPQQAAWQQQYNEPHALWRQPRFGRRENLAAFGGEPTGYAATYAYESQYSQSQYSWSASGESFGGGSALDGMISQQASAAGVPLSLAERVVRRESGGNPRAMHAGNYGLMQIRLGAARAMGYGGSAAGLLDPAVNMTYAMRYLVGAYRAAGGNESRALALYSRGY